MITEREAEQYVRRAYGVGRGRDGRLYIEHTMSVVALCRHDARAIAWLQHWVEYTDYTFPELTQMTVIGATQVRALRLLHYRPAIVSWAEFIADICAAEGIAGEWAREVKEADLMCLLRLSTTAANPERSRRYRRALYALRRPREKAVPV